METIKNVSISELHSFRNHPFKVKTNMELCELMRSIEKEGVLVPLLVRTNPYGDGYEVISGHRRKEAALWAGETEVPVVIRELDDDQAVVAMVDSNRHRENLKPSEKAFAYRMKLEAMKHQGKKVLADDITLAQAEPRSTKKDTRDVFYGAMRSNELLAKQAGESVARIKRYIRLTNLIPKILDMVDEGKIAFTVAVELSYLKEEEQYELYAIMDLEQCTPSLSQACRLKVMSQHGTLDMDAICMVLEEEKPNQREQIKLRADALAKYFPEDYTPKQKTDLIEQLLKEWYEKQEYSKQETIDIAKVSCILCGIMLIVLGNYMTKSKKNAVIGLRTSWSIFNDNTWRKSNRFGAICIIIAGGLTVVTSAFANGIISTIFLLLYIIVASVLAVIYSKKVYDNERKKEQNI